MKKVPLKFKCVMSENLHLILHHIHQLSKTAHMHQFVIKATGVGNKAVHKVHCDLIHFCFHCLCPQPQVVWTDKKMPMVWAEGMQVVGTDEGCGGVDR